MPGKDAMETKGLPVQFSSLYISSVMQKMSFSTQISARAFMFS